MVLMQPFRFALNSTSLVFLPRSPLELMVERRPQLQPALGIVDHLRRRFGRFNLRADFL